MRKKRLSVIIILVVVVLTTLLGVEIVLENEFGVRLMRPDIHKLRITGHVKDGRTGKPIERARVIVLCETAGVKSSFRCFGVNADQQGAFVVDAQVNESLRRELSVLAAGPGDLYGFTADLSPTISRGTISTDVSVALQPLAPEDQNRVRYKYETFCPFCPPETSLQFLDEGWEATFHGEVATNADE